MVVGNRRIPTTIGRRTTFGHRCMVIGATVGDLCEIGNASKLMPGARLGDRVFLGEGTLVPAGMTLAERRRRRGAAGAGRAPASADDLARLLALRDGDLSVPPATAITVEDTQEIDRHGPALRVSRHPAGDRRLGRPVPDRRDHR